MLRSPTLSLLTLFALAGCSSDPGGGSGPADLGVDAGASDASPSDAAPDAEAAPDAAFRPDAEPSDNGCHFAEPPPPTATILACNLSRPAALALDDTSVYFSVDQGHAVSRVPKTGGEATPITTEGYQALATSPGYLYSAVDVVTLASGQLSPLPGGTASSLAVDDAWVYVMAPTELLRFPLGGGSAATLTTRVPLVRPVAPRIALAGEYVYWIADSTTAADLGALVRVPKSGGDVEVVRSDVELSPRSRAVVGTRSSVYYVTGGCTSPRLAGCHGGLFRVETSTTTAEPVIFEPDTLIVDAAVGDRIYWSTLVAVRSARLDGTQPRNLATGGAPAGLMLDDRFLYWMDPAQSGDVVSFGSVLKMPR